MAEFKVQYLPGEAKAVGYINNNVVAEHVVKTAAEATQLKISYHNNVIQSNTSEYAFLEISVTDQTGNVVPDAQHPITVTVQGDADLVGLDNADQYSHEAYKTNSRKAYNGRLLATVKIGKTKEMVSVTVNANGLNPATTEINIQLD